MLRSDFHFELPRHLIAQHPPKKRGDSRLLILDGNSGALHDSYFPEVADLLHPGDLLVFNDTRVIPARLFGRKTSGGKVEILIERIVDDRLALAHIRASRSPQPGSRIVLEGNIDGQMDGQIDVLVNGRQDELFMLRFETDSPLLSILDRYGHVPLPPYITRGDTRQDSERYQTVYARRPGAVAAPTAGLHFTEGLLKGLAARGVEQAFVTLHVGTGTFQPMRVQHVEDHCMHREVVEVSAPVCEQVRAAKARGGRVVAVGTTVVRSLEAACGTGDIEPLRGETRIFIYPGYRFRCVDALITNFHLPESTLLMLVAAFAGYEHIMDAYRHAVAKEYRFFSYGDAMFIIRCL